MTTARKDHVCTLCHEVIEKGTDYVYATIKIWDHPDNDNFGTYKAHHECDSLWNVRIGREVDWTFPIDNQEWLELK